MEILLTILYTAFFIIIIYKWRLFKINNLSIGLIVIIFILKICMGLSLNYIYNSYYKDKNTADVYKNFYDSKHIYRSLKEDPGSFFKLISGINDQGPELNVYLDSTVHWNYQLNTYSDLTNTDHNTMSNNRTITKFNALVRMFSRGFISVHVVFMCFLSLIGGVLLLRAYLPFVKDNKKLLMIVIFLTPSVLFWSSGILKEGLISFGLGAMIYSLFNLSGEKRFSIKLMLLFVFSTFIIYITKYYLLLILLPLSITFYIVSINNQKVFIKYFIYFLVLSGGIISVDYFYPENGFVKIIVQKQNEQIRIAAGGYYYVQFDKENNQRLIRFEKNIDNHINTLDSNVNSLSLSVDSGIPYQIYENGIESEFILTTEGNTYKFLDSSARAGSYYKLPTGNNSFLSILFSTPKAVFNTFTKPMFWEGNSLLLKISALENIVVILFIVVMFLVRKINFREKNVVLFNLFFVVQLYAIIGFICPVIGGLVRYKVPGLLILLVTIVVLIGNKRVIIRN